LYLRLLYVFIISIILKFCCLIYELYNANHCIKSLGTVVYKFSLNDCNITMIYLSERQVT